MKKKLPIFDILPLDAVRKLRDAAATDIPPDDPQARIDAINVATVGVKAEYPQYFKKELPNGSQT